MPKIFMIVYPLFGCPAPGGGDQRSFYAENYSMASEGKVFPDNAGAAFLAEIVKKWYKFGGG
jgi:hypothetical protein